MYNEIIKTGKKTLILFSIIYLISPLSIFSAEKGTLPLDPTILIYSRAHAPDSYVKEKTSILAVSISAFEPISQIWVNGELFQSPQTSRATLDLPFDLSVTPATFSIQVYTASGRNRKVFTLNRGSKTKPQKSPFQLISILGLTRTDNLNNEILSHDKDQALKSVLTLVPRYRVAFDANSGILIKGVLLREKYTKKKFSDKEIAFSQLSSQWIMKNTLLGEVTAELGRSDIRTDNSNILISEEHSKTEIYLSGNMKQRISPKRSWNLELRLKNKDSIPEPLNDNYDADGVELKLNAGVKGEFADVKVALKAGYTINEAKGKYQDYSSLNFSIEESMSIGKWVPSLKHYRKERTMVNAEPLKSNLTPHYSTHTLTVKLKYNLNPSVIFSLESKEKKQLSNINDYNYTQNTTTLGVTYVY